ncbi:hypothetical protein CDD83_11101 [Cordyceps sp. RAO-2017]|nr:hypothetical protein CDD83_11101 [Cordyceps sp. RAO-2017]
MDKLPAEVVYEILRHVPPSCRKAARLASRRFSAVLAKQSFPLLPAFLDADVAQSILELTLAEMSPRPHSVWSPRCSVPDKLPLPQSFLLALYVALAGHSWWPTTGHAKSTGSDEESGDENDVGSERKEPDGVGITVQRLGKRLAREDVTEEGLRRAMFRYALYLSYHYDGKGEAPQLWVFDEQLWATKA